MSDTLHWLDICSCINSCLILVRSEREASALASSSFRASRWPVKTFCWITIATATLSLSYSASPFSSVLALCFWSQGNYFAPIRISWPFPLRPRLAPSNIYFQSIAFHWTWIPWLLGWLCLAAGPAIKRYSYSFWWGFWHCSRSWFSGRILYHLDSVLVSWPI